VGYPSSLKVLSFTWRRTVFSSPELKAQVSYSDCLLSVCPSICLSVNFFFYIFVFSRTTEPILTRLGTNHPWVEGIQVCSNEEKRPPTRGENSKREKYTKNFSFSTTSRLNSIKLGTNYPWVKEIQVCSNKGPGLLQWGDSHKNVNSQGHHGFKLF
jgi:hypothetical protein